MSGFVVIYDRSSTPVNTDLFERAMNFLKHRGPDGRDVSFTEHAALGHWHFWTTPEEVGEKQPLELNGLPFKIVFDGRLDNRAEILDGLKPPLENASRLSDAALLLYAYERWGRECFERLIGEYALVIFDEWRGELICARDALGDRSLFYSIHDSRIIIASEPRAAAVEAPELNESAVSHFFCFTGKTEWRNIL